MSRHRLGPIAACLLLAGATTFTAAKAPARAPADPQAALVP